MKAHFLAIYLLLVAAGLYLHLHSDLSVPINRPLQQFPAAVNSWRMTDEGQLSGEVQNVLKASDVLIRQYQGPQGEKVQLYIGYHGGGKGGGEIHSPKHCLPGSGWLEHSSNRYTIKAGKDDLNLVQAVYQKGESSEFFLYWYQVRGKSLSEEFSLKGQQILNSVLHRRRDASFIRVSIPFQGDERQAKAVGERFVKEFLPAIRTFLPS
ncbi:exopolysaccharide synthesis periplasmic protein I [Citrifermentans bemidjiense Bem]|uniref:Exopolysaccharide synthesis periplasmic protein I n=1 Tax=Citrifermentans bemidjiense (strain ATCC BAA-1014 / DSM 16622 / JCM 12645 / Bem) TaxID=404380 RepID=B5EAB4_CITBB|nr:exosortase C-terminal domain/associated protein EpsI [Citrifermentans bemidjiense]ACH38820.1 exopolysaccharide synthesis periplasmic protein I [Citrifermentans bemidjiense Bem]